VKAVALGGAWAHARLLRPSHWVKNVFVLAGLFFSENWRDPVLGLKALAAFLAFCLAASAVYCLNDAADAEKDRLHPAKRFRPVASGEVGQAMAWSLAAVLIAGSAGLSAWGGPGLLWAVSGYLAVNVLYSFGLKHLVLVDVFCIAAGFILRLLAGTWGIGIEPSQWFLLCTMALSLFLGFSKRYAELMDPQRDLEDKRAVLRGYSPELLRVLLGVTLSATLMAYGLYTTSPRTLEVHGTARLIYTLPPAMFAMFRYLYLVMQRGYGENTVADMLRDRPMLASAAVYLAVAGGLLYAGG
jgi:4-hydroxybenzoate polyprenyltransferase